MPKLTHLAFACAFVTAAAAPAAAKPPMEAFGDVPEIRAAELSPDGKRMAFLQRIGEVDYLAIHDFEAKKSQGLVSVTDIKARSITFVGDNYVVLTASKTTRTFGYRGRYEFSASFAYNLTTKKIVQLLVGTDDIYPAQSGLGDIVAVDAGGKHVYMPAFMGANSRDPAFDVIKVNLDTGRGLRQLTTRGTSSTIDWIVNAKGEAVAREDFSEDQQQHRVRAFSGGSGREIFSDKTDLISVSMLGLSGRKNALVTSTRVDSDFLTLYEMSLDDGAITGPILQRSDADVEAVIMDENRVVHGVRYSGMFPSYEMFDPALNADLKAATEVFPASAVYLDSWSSDWSKLLLLVDGGLKPQRYVLFDRTARKFLVVSNTRPSIKDEDVAEVVTIEYKARDGLKIPGLITWPTGVKEADRKKLPFVVLPHGGPEAYDAVGFDWMAQFLANEGYGVLQPNFRGSEGFGGEFRNAGRGQWGRKMQDDITDGINALIKMGWADGERVCIVGASYGGYAALAGGALTPDLYKCVVSIAGVSDLREMLGTERRDHGTRSLTYSYWRELIGDPDKDREAIDAVSPARHAASFKAPVLLLHGSDDTVVQSSQSDRMANALKAADKPVTYVRIRGDDHWFATNESRHTLLTSMGEFLAKYLKPGG
jgi:dipeptidyl aminopeptidase/acylaminoacyl peptidase